MCRLTRSAAASGPVPRARRPDAAGGSTGLACRFSAALLALACVPQCGVAWAQPAVPGPVSPDAHTLFLEVRVNQTPQPGLLRVERLVERMRVSVRDLRAIGFALPGRAPEELVDLTALPGVHVRYDGPGQRLEIDAPLALLNTATTRLNQRTSAGTTHTPAAPGAVVNYDARAGYDDDALRLVLSTELRLFGVGNGVLSHHAVTRNTSLADVTGQRHVRLDTRYEWSRPDQAVSLVIGDSVSSGLGWTRPVRFGGLRIGRDFSLQPYQPTAPLPTFAGEAVLPSTVELLVDGVRQYIGQVPVGPFELTNQAPLSGAGQAQIVVTDMFGRTQVMNIPYYSTPRLLRAGLTDWSLSLGYLRQDYGLKSSSYDDKPLMSASLRHGWRDSLTAEAHVEGGDSVRMGGGGLLWQMGQLGMLSVAHASSAHEQRRGHLDAVGYSWQTRHLSFGFERQQTDADYVDLGARYGHRAPRLSERAQMGFQTPGYGSFGLSYLHLEHHDPERQPARYASLHWSRSVGTGWHLSLSYSRDLIDSRQSRLNLGLSLPLGEQRRASFSAEHGDDRRRLSAEVSQPVPTDEGLGWRLRADHSQGSRDSAVGEATWQGAQGRIGAGAAQYGGRTHAYVQGSGGLIWMDRRLFATRTQYDAFALVSTDGVADVPVMLENHVIGQTDAQGQLLAGPLRPWQHNSLRIDPLVLPANLRVDTVAQTVSPASRAGVRARFAIEPVRAALIVLHDSRGRPLPLGARVRLAARADAEAVVGYDGETYLEGLGAANRLVIEHAQGRCEAAFDFPDPTDTIPRIGPLTCTELP
ncbi:fimbria/pilus outer membrane usher protein [Hydrogenophaga sp.]|uniref:fimbria/pilus outer membrane usher protein n=1 Tax=Hydrogenophaga sp. TaxID=1904254 RepID=UPI00272123E1|nr:fimbria/pilus outer membrane usher protein [Hydrogenophaga sp.]MDO9135883.1 fimbria/pilus outer membrane usher protein [Hydrogenophaga sp.]